MRPTTLKRHRDVQTNILPDGHVMLYLESTNWFYILTPLGGLMWEFCDGSNSVDEIVKRLADIPGLPDEPDRHSKLTELIDKLRTLGLLVQENTS